MLDVQEPSSTSTNSTANKQQQDDEADNGAPPVTLTINTSNPENDHSNDDTNTNTTTTSDASPVHLVHSVTPESSTMTNNGGGFHNHNDDDSVVITSVTSKNTDPVDKSSNSSSHTTNTNANSITNSNINGKSTSPPTIKNTRAPLSLSTTHTHTTTSSSSAAKEALQHLKNESLQLPASIKSRGRVTSLDRSSYVSPADVPSSSLDDHPHHHHPHHHHHHHHTDNEEMSCSNEEDEYNSSSDSSDDCASYFSEQPTDTNKSSSTFFLRRGSTNGGGGSLSGLPRNMPTPTYHLKANESEDLSLSSSSNSGSGSGNHGVVGGDGASTSVIGSGGRVHPLLTNTYKFSRTCSAPMRSSTGGGGGGNVKLQPRTTNFTPQIYNDINDDDDISMDDDEDDDDDDEEDLNLVKPRPPKHHHTSSRRQPLKVIEGCEQEPLILSSSKKFPSSSSMVSSSSEDYGGGSGNQSGSYHSSGGGSGGTRSNTGSFTGGGGGKVSSSSSNFLQNNMSIPVGTTKRQSSGGRHRRQSSYRSSSCSVGSGYQPDNHSTTHNTHNNSNNTRNNNIFRSTTPSSTTLKSKQHEDIVSDYDSPDSDDQEEHHNNNNNNGSGSGSSRPFHRSFSTSDGESRTKHHHPSRSHVSSRVPIIVNATITPTTTTTSSLQQHHESQKENIYTDPNSVSSSGIGSGNGGGGSELPFIYSPENKGDTIKNKQTLNDDQLTVWKQGHNNNNNSNNSNNSTNGVEDSDQSAIGKDLIDSSPERFSNSRVSSDSHVRSLGSLLQYSEDDTDESAKCRGVGGSGSGGGSGGIVGGRDLNPPTIMNSNDMVGNGRGSSLERKGRKLHHISISASKSIDTVPGSVQDNNIQGGGVVGHSSSRPSTPNTNYYVGDQTAGNGDYMSKMQQSVNNTGLPPDNTILTPRSRRSSTSLLSEGDDFRSIRSASTILEPYIVYPERWIMLLYVSFLNLLSDWTCFSIAPISLLANDAFGSINPEYLVTMFLAANAVATALEPSILSRLGLRRTIVFGSFLLMCGSVVKSGGIPGIIGTTLEKGEGEWRIYAGFLLVGLSQPLYQCTPALLSSSWFPEHERTLATSVALNSNQLGIGCAFVFGTTMVVSSDDILPYFGLLSLLSTICFLGCYMHFSDAPPTPPSGSARVMRGTMERKLPNLGSARHLLPVNWGGSGLPRSSDGSRPTHRRESMSAGSISSKQSSIARNRGEVTHQPKEQTKSHRRKNRSSSSKQRREVSGGTTQSRSSSRNRERTTKRRSKNSSGRQRSNKNAISRSASSDNGLRTYPMAAAPSPASGNMSTAECKMQIDELEKEASQYGAVAPSPMMSSGPSGGGGGVPAWHHNADYETPERLSREDHPPHWQQVAPHGGPLNRNGYPHGGNQGRGPYYDGQRGGYNEDYYQPDTPFAHLRFQPHPSLMTPVNEGEPNGHHMPHIPYQYGQSQPPYPYPPPGWQGPPPQGPYHSHHQPYMGMPYHPQPPYNMSYHSQQMVPDPSTCLPPPQCPADDGAEPILTQLNRYLDIKIRDNQVILSVIACFSRPGFVHSVVAFTAGGIVINTLSTYMDYLVRLGGSGRGFVGLVGGLFQVLVMLSSFCFGKLTDKTRAYYAVVIGLLVFGAFALAECDINLDQSRGGDLRWSLLFAAVMIGPLQPVATELGVDVAYPLCGNTVLVIQQLFSNLFSALFIPFFKSARDFGVQGEGDFERPQYTFSFYMLIVVHVVATVFFATFNGKYMRLEEEQKKRKAMDSDSSDEDEENERREIRKGDNSVQNDFMDLEQQGGYDAEKVSLLANK